MSYTIYDFSQSYHSVLLEKNTKNVYSFGWNDRGQLGLGDNINRSIPTLLNFEFDGNIINISLGEHHSMVLTDKNKIYSFGHNSYGQLGHGDNSNKYVPTLINF
jgi:alpha-tubulin suppressor-like RCC1 family protein